MAAPRILPLCNQTFSLNFDSQMSATTHPHGPLYLRPLHPEDLQAVYR